MSARKPQTWNQKSSANITQCFPYFQAYPPPWVVHLWGGWHEEESPSLEAFMYIHSTLHLWMPQSYHPTAYTFLFTLHNHSLLLLYMKLNPLIFIASFHVLCPPLSLSLTISHCLSQLLDSFSLTISTMHTNEYSYSPILFQFIYFLNDSLPLVPFLSTKNVHSLTSKCTQLYLTWCLSLVPFLTQN